MTLTTALVVYGFEAKRSELTLTIMERGCHHALSNYPNAKFCCECGKPLYVSTKQKSLVGESSLAEGEISFYFTDADSDLVIVGCLLSYTREYSITTLHSPTEKQMQEVELLMREIVSHVGGSERLLSTYLLLNHSY